MIRRVVVSMLLSLGRRNPHGMSLPVVGQLSWGARLGIYSSRDCMQAPSSLR